MLIKEAFCENNKTFYVCRAVFLHSSGLRAEQRLLRLPLQAVEREQFVISGRHA